MSANECTLSATHHNSHQVEVPRVVQNEVSNDQLAHTITLVTSVSQVSAM
jgi:hypothetical protein